MQHPFLSTIIGRCFLLGGIAAALIFSQSVRAETAPTERSLNAIGTPLSAQVATPVPESSTVTLSIVGVTGLLIAGGFRSRLRRKSEVSRGPDFEGAFRRQNGNRVRVARMPAHRHDTLPLRRHASRLGYDH